jgi:hypothetical protein
MGRWIMGAALVVMSAFAAGEDAAKPSAVAQEPAKPSAQAEPPAKAEERVLSVEKSNVPPKCEIKPVMTDEELRACGARIPK